MYSKEGVNNNKVLEESIKWISIAVKIQISIEPERDIKTERDGVIILYEELERHLKVIWFIW